MTRSSQTLRGRRSSRSVGSSRSVASMLPAGLTVALGLALTACGTGVNINPVQEYTPSLASATLSSTDVDQIVKVAAASINVPLTIAVTDRRGTVLAVYNKAGAPTTALKNYQLVDSADEVAASLARTAAFFSNDQAPLSSRTVRFISGTHFPLGVLNSESGPLYDIEGTNRGCGFNVTYLPGQSLPVPTRLNQPTTPGLGIITGKADLLDSDQAAVNPGGVPIFKAGKVAGGIGVVAAAGTPDYNAVVEYAALVGGPGAGFAPDVPYPGAVVVGGVTLPFVEQTQKPGGYTTGKADGAYSRGPIGSVGPVPEGDLIAERGSTMGGLTLAQVQQIVQNTVATGNLTRAAIRLPVGARARFVIAVADLDGSLLALYRMPDATVFSVDVAVAKSRNVIWFSSGGYVDLPGVPQGTAVTNRTIDFAAQPLYPEGIDGTPPGPFFQLFTNDTANPCTQGSQPKNANQNGIVFFPGSLPLYVGGKLVGGLGVSGDGVDQDDYATAGGAKGFEPPVNIRPDNYFIRGVRLTYQKFPADPTD